MVDLHGLLFPSPLPRAPLNFAFISPPLLELEFAMNVAISKCLVLGPVAAKL